MWFVINRTPYAVDRTWIQDKDANKLWLVVVKATFDIQPDGSTQLAGEQAPVLRTAKPFGEFGRSSLAYDSDFFGLKPATDVLVNGSAWAPKGKRAYSVDVQLTVGSIKKSLRVFGDRVWERGIAGGASISGPKPFESIPIRYERAYGGWDRSPANPSDHRVEDRNPVGTGFLLRAEGCDGVQLPNVEYPDHLINSWKHRPPPAGLNAIDCSWSPRREFAGTYDAQWQRTRSPLWAENFDQRYNSCAPADQRTQAFLRGGETVELVNLTPDGYLSFQLPKIYPFFQTRFLGERVDHRAQLCTVILEPDIARVVLVWQTSLVCNHRVDELEATVVTEKRFI